MMKMFLVGFLGGGFFGMIQGIRIVVSEWRDPVFSASERWMTIAAGGIALIWWTAFAAVFVW